MKKVLLFVCVAAFVLTGLLAIYRFFAPPQTPPVVRETPQTSPSPVPTPKNFEQNPKLQAETDALLKLFGQMPPVPVYLKDEIINKEGSNTERGVAFTACESENRPTIFIKKVFYEKANRKMLVNILKHELTHAYFCRQGIQAGHDARFRKKFTEVGGFGN